VSQTKLTPMLQQYLEIKEQHPDALLFYRMGDFYELFFDDAETAARELSIALTSRNPDAAAPVPMCGVPHHAAETYLARLLDKGFRVAICDQVEDPRQAQGLVKRAVTRVLTPGTVVEDANLVAKEHNYLAAMFFDPDAGRGGLAWVDVSTGAWSGLQAPDEARLWQWAAKVGPREMLVPRDYEPPRHADDFQASLTRLPERQFEARAGAQRIMAAQQVADLAALDLADKPELVRACGALLAYLHQTQRREDVPLAQFAPVNLSRCLLLDEITERNLEIFRRLDGGRGKGTLWAVMDRTMTPMGGRLLADRLRQPWKDTVPIRKSLDCVQFMFERDALRAELRDMLDTVYDLERLATRIVLGRATPKDFLALRSSLAAVPGIRSLMEDGDGRPEALAELLAGWDSLQDQADLLGRALADNPPPVITEGGLFRPGYHAALDELMALTEDGQGSLDDLLARERADTGLDKLRMGHNKVFGHYFELPRSMADKAPERFARRQTLVNFERFVTDELKELEDRLVSAADKRKDLEYKLFMELREAVAAQRHRFMDMAARLAALDCWQGLAQAARDHDWTRPELLDGPDDGLDMDVASGRHPVVEAVQGAANYVPCDLSLTTERRIMLITGPNMAGKSTVLRMAALVTIMAQAGSFVPAARARLSLCDRVFSRVGASDNLAQGRSTFMVEMMETARILRQATARSLVILDEIGRGTSTYDGLSLAWSVVEDLARRGTGGVRTLFATHYHELTALEGRIPGVANCNIAIKEHKGDIVFLRRLIPGPSDRSYGIEVAKLAGVPRPVVTRAKEILAGLEQRSASARAREQALVMAAQGVLPGMAQPSRDETVPQAQVDIPAPVRALMEALGELTVDTLTPIEALNFIHAWKTRLKSLNNPED